MNKKWKEITSWVILSVLGVVFIPPILFEVLGVCAWVVISAVFLSWVFKEIKQQ